ncbi:MAG: acyl carrier protein [bacterium]|nr:acyl carrier protein [bacterium]
MATIQDELINFIKENFIAGRSDTEVDIEASLIDTGIIDSTGVLELVTYIEDTYSIEVDDEELIPENLDSVKNIIAFLGTKGIK